MSLDVNQDLRISRREWAAGPESFRQLDGNRDGVLTPRELIREWSNRRERDASSAGVKRGRLDGRSAGLDDRASHHDLDPQAHPEFDQADSGYRAEVGPRREYRAGYRQAFSAAYREGFAGR